MAYERRLSKHIARMEDPPFPRSLILELFCVYDVISQKAAWSRGGTQSHSKYTIETNL